MSKLDRASVSPQSNHKQNLCQDCAFSVRSHEIIECTHPDETGVDCTQVVFCCSFQPLQEIDSPCVCFDD